VTTGRPDYMLDQFGQMGRQVKGQFVITYHRTYLAIWFDCCLLAVLCCHLATENVMKLLYLAFCYIAARGGVCCALHHSLYYLLLNIILLCRLCSLIALLKLNDDVNILCALQTLTCCPFLVFALPLPPVVLVLQPPLCGTCCHLAFETLPLPIPSVAFLKLTPSSRLSAPSCGSPNPIASDSASG